MSHFSTGLRVAALGLLLCQLGLLTALPIALCRLSPVMTLADAACTCEHEPGAQCPMHQGSSAESRSDFEWCAGCGDTAEIIVATVASDSGILSAPPQTPELEATGIPLPVARNSTRSLATPPNSPPPRRALPA